MTLEKTIVACDFCKSSFGKVVVGWMKACLVELLWLLEKSRNFQASPACHAHMSLSSSSSQISSMPNKGRRLPEMGPPQVVSRRRWARRRSFCHRGEGERGDSPAPPTAGFARGRRSSRRWLCVRRSCGCARSGRGSHACWPQRLPRAPEVGVAEHPCVPAPARAPTRAGRRDSRERSRLRWWSSCACPCWPSGLPRAPEPWSRSSRAGRQAPRTRKQRSVEAACSTSYYPLVKPNDSQLCWSQDFPRCV
jgi:hypothetical protein